MAAPFWQGGYTYFPGDIVQPVTAPAPNVPMVANGDFSAGASGWDYSGGAAYALDGHGYGGNGCLRLPGNTPDGLGLNQTKLYVEPGGTLTASCMIEQGASAVRATAGWVEIHWFASDDTPVQAPDKGNEVNDGRGGAWHKSTVASARPAAASYARAGIHLTSVADHNYPIWGDALTVSGASAGLPAGLVYKAVQAEAGASAANEPAWPSILGQQVIDGDVIWEAVTTSRITWTATPRYLSGAVEPVWPEDMGGMVQDGSINWRAVPRRVEDERCPNSKVVAILASKVFAADRDIVRFSATANPLDWSTAEDAGYLPTGLQQANANDMAVLVPYRKNLTAWNASSFQNWQADPDPASMAILDQMDGIGSTWPRAAVPVANDLFYLAALGVRSVGIANAAENLVSNDVGAPVDPLVQSALRVAVANNTTAIGTYYPSAGQYWLAFPAFPAPQPAAYGQVPDGIAGDSIEPTQYMTAGGVAPYIYQVVAGQMPPGLTLQADGRVTGNYGAAGTYTWTVRSTDSDGESSDVTDTATVRTLEGAMPIPVLSGPTIGFTSGGAPGRVDNVIARTDYLGATVPAGVWLRVYATRYDGGGYLDNDFRGILYNTPGAEVWDSEWRGNPDNQVELDARLAAAGLGEFIGPIDPIPPEIKATVIMSPVDFASYKIRTLAHALGEYAVSNVRTQYPNPALIPAGSVPLTQHPGYYQTPDGQVYVCAWSNP